MALVDLDTFRAYINASRVDITDAALIQAALDAAEGWITTYCGRQFVVAGTATTRTYPVTYGDVLEVDDFTSATSVTVDGSTLTASTYQLEPLNTLGTYGAQQPYWQIRRYTGWYPGSLPGKATVAVTATWGWVAIPAQVVEACKIVARDLLSSQNGNTTGFAPYTGGTSGERAAKMLLAPFRRAAAFGIA
jgi:hypothetical protein